MGDQGTVLDMGQDVTFQCWDGFWRWGGRGRKSDHLENGREVMQEHLCR